MILERLPTQLKEAQEDRRNPEDSAERKGGNNPEAGKWR